MKRLWPAVVIAVLLLGACGRTDRPEGVVERWLISLNQGKAGEPEKYAPGGLSRQILPHWHSRDPGDLDVIEVGKGVVSQSSFEGGTLVTAVVPFRVERTSGVKLERVASLQKDRDGWHLNGLFDRDPSLRVPSEGGERIGSASAGTWALAVAISAALMLLVALVIRTQPKPMPLPTSGDPPTLS